jgi:hypothetical protein
MASVRIDKAVAVFMKKKAETSKRPNGKYLSVMLAESLKEFMNKDDECFSCPHHREQLARLELGRQRLARERLAAGRSDKRGDAWISLRDDIHEQVVAYAATYRRSVKVVAEQAIMEYVTRPTKCESCPMAKRNGKKINV